MLSSLPHILLWLLLTEFYQMRVHKFPNSQSWQWSLKAYSWLSLPLVLSIKLLAILLFACIINLSSSSYFSPMKPLFFFDNTIRHGGLHSLTQIKAVPQAELLLEWLPLSLSWHWVRVATTGFLSFLPLPTPWTSSLKVNQGRSTWDPSILGLICLGKNSHHINGVSGE